MPPRTPLERFHEKISENPNGCWVWNGNRNPDDYGRFWLDGKKILAHRFAYETLRAPIPPELELDHLCRDRGCVNPDHLEPVTHAENIRRGLTGKVNHRNARKTHCLRGHPFDGVLNATNRGWTRFCWTCKRERARPLGQTRAQSGITSASNEGA